jgi:RNA polymerase sigma factor (sigma-70 family)
MNSATDVQMAVETDIDIEKELSNIGTIDYEKEIKALGEENLKGLEYDEVHFYQKTFLTYPVLSQEELVKLFMRLRVETDESLVKKIKDKILLHNLRALFFFGRKYISRGLSLNDLVQEGIPGLMKAIDKYKYERGYKFMTYASWWIKSFMRRAIQNQVGTVRIPVHRQDLCNQVRKAVKDLTESLKRMPTSIEIAVEVGCKAYDVEYFLSGGGKVVIYFDQNIGDDPHGDTFHSKMPDDKVIGPADTLCCADELRDLAVEIEKLLSAVISTAEISERNADIFVKYYALDGSSFDASSLEMVARSSSLTRERVRQLLAKTWRILGSYNMNPRIKILKIRSQKDLFEKLGRIRELEGIVGQSISFSQIFLNVKARSIVRDASLSSRKKKYRISVKHFRASPAFINWRPREDKSLQDNLLSFINFTYEVELGFLKGNSRVRMAEFNWARKVHTYILYKDCGVGFVPSARQYAEFEELENCFISDKSIENDISRMRWHFRKMMKLDKK